MRNSLRWYFRPQLVAIALLALLSWASIERIIESLDQDPPYFIAYGEDGDIVRRVSRSAFLRHEIGLNAMMLVLFAIFWGIAAKSLEDEGAMLEKELDSSKRKMADLQEAMSHDRDCRRRTDSFAKCGCPIDEKDRRYRELVKMWTAAGTAPNYDKKAWNSVVSQLKALDLV